MINTTDSAPHWWEHVDVIPQQVVMIDLGDQGPEVHNVQRLLKEAGYAISVDGDFGPGTERVVRRFQKDVGLVQDGRVGPKTFACLEKHPKDPTVLSQEDLEDAARMLDVPVAAIMAVNAVESRGSGFFAPDTPAILFERHIMRRRMKHHGIVVNDYVDQYPHLVNPSPGGYKGGLDEHQRLNAAQQLHEVSALESASWGLFQIMGYHWEHLGYTSAQTYVSAMKRSERDHLMAFVKFNQRDLVLLDALRTQDWARYARRYNGPAYQKNRYDEKLAAAFTRYSETRTA